MTMGYVDNTLNLAPGGAVIYLAGGCFWGLEKFLGGLPGVYRVTPGYANGSLPYAPSYEMVVGGGTGFKEAVRVEYYPERLSLEIILAAFFHVIDPTVKNRQGPDVGTQYQTGIYYVNDADGERVRAYADEERRRHRKFAVELLPLVNFYEAEEYHKGYLDKNPGGYCHISPARMASFKDVMERLMRYPLPPDEELRARLSPMQYAVTRGGHTELPFRNEFFDHEERGIYVDAASGEPLFSSSDKYGSSCGWPAFSKSIDESSVLSLPDHSHGMIRTEVKSRAGRSHLGHVFEGDRESPSGVRYCINSAALRFIPYAKMEEQGYGHLMDKVK